jgi:tetratricopeptide (TPR) repeat protein
MRGFAIAVVLCLLACAQTTVDAPAEADRIPVTTVSDDAREHYVAGREKAELLRTAQARAEYRAALELDEEFALAWLGMAMVSGSREEAERCLDRAVALADGVTEAESLHIRATRAAWNGNSDEAQALWARLATELLPNSAEANYQLGISYWSSNDPAGLPYLERAVEIDPSYHVAWNMLGYMYPQFGHLDKAVEAHRRYVELVPDEPNSHDSYAETLLRAGRYRESIAEYRAALAIDPEFLASMIGIAHNLTFERRYDEAQAAYEGALAKAKEPQDAYVSNTWIVTFGVYAKRPDVALAAAERGIRLAGELGAYEAAAAVRELARIRLWRGENAQARETAGRAMARMGEAGTKSMRRDIANAVLRLLVEIDLADRELTTATARLDDLRSAGGNPWQVKLIAFSEGLVALKTRRTEDAIAAFGRSFETDPRAMFYHGVALEAAGRKDEAADLYEAIVKLNMPSLGHALVYSKARARLSVLRYR